MRGLAIVDEKVTAAIVVARPSAMRASSILIGVELSFPVVHTDAIEHEQASFAKVVARNQMCRRPNQDAHRFVQLPMRRS